MLFFRSEERARDWCEANVSPVRPLVSLEQLWGLARAWYGSRLQADSRRPQPKVMREIFAHLRLAGGFWDPESDDFGPG
jgi:hypothetical protein